MLTYKFSRRRAIALPFLPVLTSQQEVISQDATAEPTISDVRPDPIDLGNGLSIQDYRLFTHKEIPRFFAEISNSGDHPVDTPVVAMVFNNGKAGEDFALANPYQPVLEPGRNGVVVGTLPDSNMNHDSLAVAEWLLCESELSTDRASIESARDIVVDSVEFSTRDIGGLFLVNVVNTADVGQSGAYLYGIAYDMDDRLIGTTSVTTIRPLSPGETRELQVWVVPSTRLIASPFHFVGAGDLFQVEWMVQPGPPAVNPGCPAVMPWNHED